MLQSLSAFWLALALGIQMPSAMPPFSVGSDMLLAGSEGEFARCIEYRDGYLADISARIERVSYAKSEDWGYVMRLVYVSDSIVGGEPEYGTMLCWTGKEGAELNVAVDVPWDDYHAPRTS